MSAGKVDVLAVIQRDLADVATRREADDYTHIDDCRRMEAEGDEALAAVAELIEAARVAADVLAETYAKYQTKIGPFASQSQKANGKLRAALARIGGGQ